MGKALVVLVVVALAVYSLFDVVAAPKGQIRWLPKTVWLVVVLVPVLGAGLWLAFGKTRDHRIEPPRPNRPTPRGPDDDPDFLRGL